MKKIKIKKNQPKVSIVFVNWNGKKYTFDLIESLRKISYENYDIIVIDNNSKEEIEKDFLIKYKKIATIIKNKKNLGLAEGTNIGIREALRRKSKYILVMNNDMVVEKDFLNPLVNAMEKNPLVAVSGPKIYYMNPKNMIWCAGCRYHFSDFKPMHQKEIDMGQADKEKYVDGIDCVLMIKSDVLKKEGLFYSELFLNQELTEWSLRVQNKGYKSLYVPKSKVWHKVDVTLKDNKKNEKISLYYNVRNWLLVVKRNKSFSYFIWILFLELTALAIYRLLRFKKLKFVPTYYQAIWHALINKTPLMLYPYS